MNLKFARVNTSRLYKIRNVLLIAIAFTIPLEPKLVTGLVILLALTSVMLFKEWSLSTFHASSKVAKLGVLSIQAFFLYHIIGLAWTSDMDAGLLDISRKLNLLFLPLLIFIIPIENKTLFRVFKAFIVGVFLSVILNLIHSIIQYQEVKAFYVFTGEHAIRNVHLGYYAVYLLLSITLIVDFLMTEKEGQESWSGMVYILLGLCSIPILVLSGSKMGFLTLSGLIVFTILFVLRGRDWKRVLFIPLAALIVLGLAVTQTQHLKDRLNTMYEVTFHSPIDPQSVESTMARRMTWITAVDIWSQAPVTGCGTGDLDIEMEKTYEQHGFTGPMEKGLNPHSQYLQSGAALGIGGFLLLLISILAPLMHGIRKGQYAVIAFFLIMLMANLTESVLERQEGVQFWAFFAPLMLIWSIGREKNGKYRKDLLNLWPF